MILSWHSKLVMKAGKINVEFKIKTILKSITSWKCFEDLQSKVKIDIKPVEMIKNLIFNFLKIFKTDLWRNMIFSQSSSHLIWQTWTPVVILNSRLIQNFRKSRKSVLFLILYSALGIYLTFLNFCCMFNIRMWPV